MKTVIKDITINHGILKVHFNDESFVESQSAEAYLLYKILKELERLNESVDSIKRVRSF